MDNLEGFCATQLIYLHWALRIRPTAYWVSCVKTIIFFGKAPKAPEGKSSRSYIWRALFFRIHLRLAGKVLVVFIKLTVVRMDGYYVYSTGHYAHDCELWNPIEKSSLSLVIQALSHLQNHSHFFICSPNPKCQWVGNFLFSLLLDIYISPESLPCLIFVVLCWKGSFVWLFLLCVCLFTSSVQGSVSLFLYVKGFDKSSKRFVRLFIT